MLKKLYKDQNFINFIENHSLCLYFKKLIEESFRKGFSGRPLRLRLATIISFLRWFSDKKLTLNDLSQKKIKSFINFRKKQAVFRGTDKTIFDDFLNILYQEKIIPPRTHIKPSHIDLEMIKYKNYLNNEKGLSINSQSYYIENAISFLSFHFGKSAIKYKNINGEKIQQYILSNLNGTITCRHIITTIRSFLRYLHIFNKTNIDFSYCVPSYSPVFETNPRDSLDDFEIKKILDSCRNKKNVTGIRNYAIISLLSELGLRGCEISSLQLKDINWGRKELLIRGKGNCNSLMPIPKKSSVSLKKYIKNIRPRCNSQYCFITIRPPYRALKHQAITSIVWRAMDDAGIHQSFIGRGSHVFRHSIAVKALEKGVGIFEIKDFLRHRSIDTSAIYARAKVLKLKEVICPWPEKNYLRGW